MRSTPLFAANQFDFHSAECVFVGVADVSDSSKLDADSATIFVCSDITISSVDDGVVLSNLTVGVTYTVTCKACNDVGNSTLSATSDPIVASPLANPPYITKVVVTRDMELMVFLSAAWNGRSVARGYVTLVPRYRSSLDKCS